MQWLVNNFASSVLLPAVVSLIVYFTIHYPLTQIFTRREKLIDEICHRMQSLVEDAEEYWLHDQQKLDNYRQQLLECRLTYRGHDLSELLSRSLKKDLTEKHMALEALGSFLSHLTGGNFQKTDRKASPDQIRHIYSSAAEVCKLVHAALEKQFLLGRIRAWPRNARAWLSKISHRRLFS